MKLKKIWCCVLLLMLTSCAGGGDVMIPEGGELKEKNFAGTPSPESGNMSGNAHKSADSDAPPAEFDICIDGPNKVEMKAPKVFYGTSQPTHVPLSQGQVLAIGTFGFCTGTLIAPTWVLSASHCNLAKWHEFCMGVEPDNPNKCIGIKRVIDNPWVDMALVELDYDARDVMPYVEPIPLLTESLGSSWLGKTAEAAGYGQQETGYSGVREFTAEPIAYLYQNMVTIDGEGKHGVCFGDSGGPVMVIAADGTTRVAGDLSNGDDSCVGYDNYARVDKQLSWIEGYTGPTVPPGPVDCGSQSFIGECKDNGKRAVFCGADNALKVDFCKEGTYCSWSKSDTGFRCVTPSEDACEGLDYSGECNGNVLTWCDVGGKKVRDCAECDEICIPGHDGNRRCAKSACGDLTTIAVCDGNKTTWCDDDGQPKVMDCDDYGDSCDYVNHKIGSWCVAEETPPSSCGELSFYGYCEGTVAHWCNRESQPETVDCADYGQKCEWLGSESGYHCTY